MEDSFEILPIRLRIKELLFERNRTAADLRRFLGVSESSVLIYSKNRQKLIPMTMIFKLCVFFKCNVEDLFEVNKTSYKKELRDQKWNVKNAVKKC